MVRLRSVTGTCAAAGARGRASPGPDGTAAIIAGAALRWIVAFGTGAHAGRPEDRQRKLVLTALANMAGKGHIRRAVDIAG